MAFQESDQHWILCHTSASESSRLGLRSFVVLMGLVVANKAEREALRPPGGRRLFPNPSFLSALIWRHLRFRPNHHHPSSRLVVGVTFPSLFAQILRNKAVTLIPILPETFLKLTNKRRGGVFIFPFPHGGAWSGTVGLSWGFERQPQSATTKKNTSDAKIKVLEVAVVV